MKEFTQEEYEELIKLTNKKFYVSVGYTSSNGKSVMNEIRENSELLSKKINDADINHVDEILNKAIALMNPCTRELVYDDFVEEGKFIWQLANGDVINLSEGEWYCDCFFSKEDAYLTEKQVKSSPFDISKFKKLNISDFTFV